MAMLARHPASRHTKSGILAIALVSLASCGGGGGGGGGGGHFPVQRITFPAGIRGGSPRFSPDGTELAYARDTGAVTELAVMTTAGADSRSLTSDGDYLLSMVWTADGAELIYGSTDAGMRTVQLSGGSSQFLLDAFAAMNPDLSPDGRWLAYALNGANLHLADLGQTPPALSDLGFAGDSPRFSPDGATLALIAGNDIQLFDIASGTSSTVLTTNNPLGRVDWFPDGSRLLAGTERGVEIITLGPPGAAAVQRQTIFNDGAVIDVDLSPDGTSVAYVQNGLPELFVLTGL